jgi:DNA-binding MarR family transcriptional regulator
MKKKLNVLDCLCHNFRKTSRLLTQSYDRALRPAGVRITQFTLMATVAEMEESAFVPLAAFLGMDRTTLGRNLELMERDGLVQVRPGANDRREQLVRLTDQGRRKLAEALPLWERAQRRALKRLGGDELPRLRSQMAKLTQIRARAD